MLAIVIAGIVACTMAVCTQSVLTVRLRPHFRQYLLEHGDEIERMGEQDGGGKGEKRR